MGCCCPLLDRVLEYKFHSHMPTTHSHSNHMSTSHPPRNFQVPRTPEKQHHTGEGSAGRGIIFKLALGVVPCCKPPARRKGDCRPTVEVADPSVLPAEHFAFALAPVALEVPARAGEDKAREPGLEPSRPGDAS